MIRNMGGTTFCPAGRRRPDSRGQGKIRLIENAAPEPCSLKPRSHLWGVGHDQAMGLTAMYAETLDRLTDAKLTYSEVGATAGKLPATYHHIRRRVVIGQGQQVFAEAATDLAAWQVQLRAGLTVAASTPTATPGTVVVLGLGLGPLRLSAPCRVVYAVDQSRRRGFAYGTLPGHPESGEEAFVVEHHEDDTVSFEITAFSKPSMITARIAGPAGRLFQSQVTRRYLRSLRR
jgi:uncharacterized protein (UPF0548 family)